MKREANPTLLVFRFSAMGDVAMVATVLRELVEQHPNLTLVLVSREPFKPFFTDIPGLIFHPFYPHGVHQAGRGLYRLFKELKQYDPQAVADLHYNIRTRLLSALFQLTGVPVRRLDKGKKEKKALTRPHHKIRKQLKPMADRYADVFRALGYPIVLGHVLRPQTLPFPASV